MQYIILACKQEGRKEMFYLMMHSTHFIYGYMVSDIWLRTILIVRKETCCRHIGYSFRLTARVIYMHHPTDRIAHITAFVTPVVEHCLEGEIAQWVHPMKDRSDDPSHHERTLLPRSYISLQHVNRWLTYAYLEERCSSAVRWVVGSIVHGGPIELFLVPASAPGLV